MSRSSGLKVPAEGDGKVSNEAGARMAMPSEAVHDAKTDGCAGVICDSK